MWNVATGFGAGGAGTGSGAGVGAGTTAAGAVLAARGVSTGPDRDIPTATATPPATARPATTTSTGLTRRRPLKSVVARFNCPVAVPSVVNERGVIAGGGALSDNAVWARRRETRRPGGDPPAAVSARNTSVHTTRTVSLAYGSSDAANARADGWRSLG